MARTAQDVLTDAVRELAPDTGANRLVPLIATGAAPRSAIAAFALEQHHVIASDRRSYRHLAERSAARPAVAAFFDPLARGETTALELLGPLAAACGLDERAVGAYEPTPGGQAYPAYTAWLALQAEPVDVVVAVTVNFAAWGGYCTTVGRALRTHYGFDDTACGFFDFFARPDPDAAERALAAVAAGLADGVLTERLAHRYGRLLQGYETMFWNSLPEG
ncbi:transcriptional regulator [Streptomyces sp. I05A-00742]|uniref:transcriptional regulator n=1 Tax=Streptomyces sp. I05A-00742 TaxID=2732853 RepID=UPI001488695A|nr:transcriptional regulator [Streptomyces sp. I05A-00742]